MSVPLLREMLVVSGCLFFLPGGLYDGLGDLQAEAH